MDTLFAVAEPYEQTTSSSSFTDIMGLGLVLPAATPGGYQSALVTLCLPGPYAEGNDFPGASVGIAVVGASTPVIASGTFTYQEKRPGSFARIPITIVADLPLQPQPMEVIGRWASVRGSTVHIDEAGLTSLSAILSPTPAGLKQLL